MEEIYKEYAQKVYSYLLNLTNNKDIAEELLQETFYSAVKNINKFKYESSIKTWLYVIAKNKWNDYYKKHKKMNEISLEEDLNYQGIVSEEDFFNKEELLDVYKKIHQLDEKSKEIVYLRIGTNFSFKEIANITGNTEENARIIFYRAKTIFNWDFKNE